MNAGLLKDLLQQGHRVAVKTKGGEWRVFLSVRHPDGHTYFQGTCSCKSIEESLREGLENADWEESDIETFFTNEYKVVTPAPKILKKGDTVEILENVREMAEREGWREEVMTMIGQRGLKVKESFAVEYRIWNKDMSNWCLFPRWAVAKCDPEEEVVEMTMADVEKLVGKKVKIIK